MSPFARGLLGGVAQGITQTASMLFADSIAAKKEERLAKIADRNYARDRADTEKDIAAQRKFQKELVSDAQGFTDQQRGKNEEFQLKVISDRQDYEEGVASTRFGQQVALQTLGEQAQARLLAEAQKYPNSPLGKLIQDRDNATTEDEKAIFNRQIAMSQVFQSTDVLGNTRFIMPNFAADNRSITSTTEVGGVASPGGSATNGASGAVDQVKLQELIEKVKAAPADANGMINMGQGLMLKEEMLRNLETKLTGTAGPPGLLGSMGALLAANTLSF
jgi:hypothetical protein